MFFFFKKMMLLKSKNSLRKGHFWSSPVYKNFQTYLNLLPKNALVLLGTSRNLVSNALESEKYQVQ